MSKFARAPQESIEAIPKNLVGLEHTHCHNHAVVNGSGLSIKLALPPGDKHDSLSAAHLLNDVPWGELFLADKAPDLDVFRSLFYRVKSG